MITNIYFTTGSSFYIVIHLAFTAGPTRLCFNGDQGKILRISGSRKLALTSADKSSSGISWSFFAITVASSTSFFTSLSIF